MLSRFCPIYRVHPDPILQSYVGDIAAPLVQASHADRQGIDYSITLLDEPKQVNAFALPGGPIFVFSGLLLLADNEAEVAGVLAHEIGHIVGRHSANQMATKLGMDMLLGMALGEQPGEVARLAAELGAGGTFAQFSRDDERESDEFGVAYTIVAGYDLRLACSASFRSCGRWRPVAAMMPCRASLPAIRPRMSGSVVCRSALSAPVHPVVNGVRPGTA